MDGYNETDLHIEISNSSDAAMELSFESEVSKKYKNTGNPCFL